MFYNCSKLKEINISNFNIDKLISADCMFYRCKSLSHLNLSSFNNKHKINMKYMLYDCPEFLTKSIKLQYKIKEEAF